MDSLQTKAKALLELYRRRGRHPRKLIMNLAYDPFSAEPLWEEALARWGEQAVEPQGPHSHQTALAYWNEAGDIKAVTPPLPSSPRTDGGASSHSTSDEENNITNVDTTAGDVRTPRIPRKVESSLESQKQVTMACRKTKTATACRKGKATTRTPVRDTVSWLKRKFILRLHNGGRACLSTVLFCLG